MKHSKLKNSIESRSLAASSLLNRVAGVVGVVATLGWAGISEYAWATHAVSRGPASANSVEHESSPDPEGETSTLAGDSGEDGNEGSDGASDGVTPKTLTVAQVKTAFEKLKKPARSSASPKQVITFLGYSGAGYEEENALRDSVNSFLKESNLKASESIINIGVTPDGVGALYEYFGNQGYMTTGVVSSQAIGIAQASPHCKNPFYVQDESWGGYVDGSHGKKELSPTSEAMVAVSDVVVAIGGGDVAAAELCNAKKNGKDVYFYSADMNRGIAEKKWEKKREAALKEGKTPPLRPQAKDIAGAAAQEWDRIKNANASRLQCPDPASTR